VNEASTFSQLLRHCRLAAALTQEELAERAGVSANAIAALERGRRTLPRADTIERLATALRLPSPERERFIAAAQGGRDLIVEERPSAQLSPHARLHIPPNALLGREQEEAAVVHLVQSGARLITLTGPGGVGKTRLAVQLGLTLQNSFADGCAFVDLSALREARLVAATIAQALKLHEASPQSYRDLLIEKLRQRRLLLVLDNFEQVIEAAQLVTEMLDECPHLCVIVTSRTPLQLRVEQQFPLSPLETPPPETAVPQDIALFSAVELFLARARLIQPSFTLTAENAASIAGICRRLDGLPLAIELAAARIRTLPPPALLTRLERGLGALPVGPQDLPVRQRTLSSTIAWSCDLLDAAEQQLFRRLAIFEGGFTLEAAAEVCGDVDAKPDDTILDRVQSLLDKNLLYPVESVDEEPCFAMLETIRAYAREQLDSGGELAAARERHAFYFTTLAERAEPHLRSGDRDAWLQRLHREADNLRSALSFALELGRTGIGLRLATALWPFWLMHGHFREGRSWFERLLAADEHNVPLELRIEALKGAAWLAQAQDDFAVATPLFEESARLQRTIGRDGDTDLLINRALQARLEGEYQKATSMLEKALAVQRSRGEVGTFAQHGIGHTMFRLGMVLREQGYLDRAAPLYEECLALHRRANDREGIALALLGLGDIARDRGDGENVAVYCGESLALFEDLGAAWGVGCCLNNLALGAYAQGRLDDAEDLATRSVSVFRTVGLEPSTGESLATLGRIILDRGDVARAEDTLRQSLVLTWTRGPRYIVPFALEGLADVALHKARLTFALQLLAAAANIHALLGTPTPVLFRAAAERTLSTLRRRLDDEEFAGAWDAGQRLSVENAIGEALRA